MNQSEKDTYPAKKKSSILLRYYEDYEVPSVSTILNIIKRQNFFFRADTKSFRKRSKKTRKAVLEKIMESFRSDKGGSIPSGNIIGFPQGVSELMLEAVLNRMFNEETKSILLYFCTKNQFQTIPLFSLLPAKKSVLMSFIITRILQKRWKLNCK